MKNFVLTVTSIVSFISLSLLIISIAERPGSQFDTYNELVESGLIESGWVTKYIPKSAKNIKEQHDVDTNWVDVYFDFEPNENEMNIEGCTLLIESAIGKKYICPPLIGQTAILTLRKDGVGIYQSHRDGLD